MDKARTTGLEPLCFRPSMSASSVKKGRHIISPENDFTFILLLGCEEEMYISMSRTGSSKALCRGGCCAKTWGTKIGGGFRNGIGEKNLCLAEGFNRLYFLVFNLYTYFYMDVYTAHRVTIIKQSARYWLRI